jgi:hypothetical protein
MLKRNESFDFYQPYRFLIMRVFHIVSGDYMFVFEWNIYLQVRKYNLKFLWQLSDAWGKYLKYSGSKSHVVRHVQNVDEV